MEEQFDKAYILELADKIGKGTITDQEWRYYNKWYDSAGYDLLELPGAVAENPFVIRDRMHEKVMSQLELDTPVKTFKIPGIWWKSAAAAVLIIGGLLFFIHRDQPGTVKPDVAVVQPDIAPGRQSATLTLADGKKIVLSDAANGQLLEEAGVSITKAADGQLVYELKDKGQAKQNKINTLSTTKGETYRLHLPDGSLVWLNAASSLTYGFSLNERGERRVKLSGEAYFEIAKDKAHPFVVRTDRQEVQVLGTHFNISAYRDESSIRTTLAEGSVKVTALGKSLVLKPNQQATLNDGAFKVKEVDAELALAWKSGFFLFNRESLESVMAKIARWYDVEVVYNDPSLKSETFTGTISRFEKISQVFNMLERTGVAKFKIEGRKINIYKIK